MKITVQAGRGRKQDLISKTTRAKRAGVVAQALQALYPEFNPNTTNKKKKNQGKS
jgi:hypothetical protein